MATVQSFRLKNDDHELEKILAGKSGKEKSDFIREALYFYIRYGDKINRIDEACSGIREILDRLDSMSVGPSISPINELHTKDGIDETEKVLKKSIQELLNL
ncbi:MAG: hypothetical protein QME73_13655 [Bacillota bacterium]|nr:hypothetical protein [Bacillota bacterium]NPV44841.1 hypothetical protein [Bacillota bacterium]